MNGLLRMRAKVGIGVALFGVALLLQGSPRAFADEPLMSTLTIDETNPVDSLCDFPLVVHEEGTIRSFLFFDQDGQVVRIAENWQDVQSTLTNPVNGNSLSYRTAGRDGFTTDHEGDLTVFRQGVVGIVTVPGYGAISGEAGEVTLTLNSDGTVETRRSGFLEEGDFSAACSYLQDAP